MSISEESLHRSAHEGASSESIARIGGGYYEKSDIIVFGAVYDGYDWL